MDYVIGAYRDVFCKKNKIFYEAQVKRLKLPKKETEKLKILFHFKGWSAKFDEWIEAGSDRIRYNRNISNQVTCVDSITTRQIIFYSLFRYFWSLMIFLNITIMFFFDFYSSHNLHTDPTSSDPRDQERWQGTYVHTIQQEHNYIVSVVLLRFRNI